MRGSSIPYSGSGKKRIHLNKYKMKTNQPLFSVLIANYNNGKYLMEAIEDMDND